MINGTLRERIKQLSINDTKNISQQCLKLMEEGGELAKVILPYDNADGTRHRFVDTDELIEGIADVILCALSISDKLGIDDDRLSEMLSKKVDKWQKLQTISNKESYPYEIHISVAYAENSQKFISDCRTIGVKGIVLALHMDSSEPIRDVMTSSTIVGSNSDVINEVNRITDELTSMGYLVARQKVETVPWHPHTEMERESWNYYESHIQVTLTDANDFDRLNEIVNEYNGCKLSRNSLKKSEDGSVVHMVTLRDLECDLDTFRNRLSNLYHSLAGDDFTFKRDNLVEWAIYDNNIAHDSKWMV